MLNRGKAPDDEPEANFTPKKPKLDTCTPNLVSNVAAAIPSSFEFFGGLKFYCERQS